MDIWTEVFDLQPEAFETTYDSYEPEERISLVIRDQDKIVASVQVFLGHLGWTDGNPVTVGLIANVSTLPSHRSLGFSSMLLEESIRLMRDQACVWSYLFTGNFRHYSRFGWAEIFQDELAFSVEAGVGALDDLQVAPWMAELYALQERKPVWQTRTEFAWKTRLGPARPWPERRFIGERGVHYAALSLSDEEVSVLEWCVNPDYEEAAVASLVKAVQLSERRKLRMLRGVADIARNALEKELGAATVHRVGRGMVLPLQEGITQEDLQRLFDLRYAHFSPLDAF